MIKKLDKHLINKIAAGEVVERPLSVVKELTENSIDAGASAITVEIKDGGLSLIRITDNGCGIPADQITLAFAQHATSKIQDIDDLMRINTLGFRGEALASIASVSHTEMITKTTGALTGSMVQLHGGTLVASQEIGCTEGTTINVSNLFFNTPARLKFLKKPAGEAGFVTDLMQRLALGYPQISFKYISGGQVMFATTSSDQKMAIYNIYGKDTARGLIEIKQDDLISGYIGKPEVSRGSRSGENFFINGRYIKSALLQNAVEEAYRGHLPVGRFPLFVIHLKVLASEIDVNVHPAKMEVRFANEKEIYSKVFDTITNALLYKELIPNIAVTKPQKAPKIAKTKPKEERYEEPHEEPVQYLVNQPVSEPITLSETDTTTASKPHDFSLITQIFNTYWLAVRGDELFLIDQHAAHEKVLYEDMLKQLKNKETVAQTLLEPYQLNLSPKELATATEYKDALNNFGFNFILKHDSKGELLSVPSQTTDPEYFVEILQKLEKGDNSPTVKIREEIALKSCKKAVKANDTLTSTEARSLINRMLSLDNPYTCPHGRPTMVKLTKKEIERMFKRI